MKLIDLLVQELPKIGGWGNTGEHCVQDFNGNLWFYKGGRPEYTSGIWAADSLSPNFNWTRWGLCITKAIDNSHSHVSHEQYEAALAASKQPVWNGEGLPPVGTECEWQDTNTKCWQKVTVVYSSEWVTVIREDKDVDPVELAIENYGSERSKEFRPIRTEAERKREEATAEMSASIAKYTEMTFLEAIYEAVAAGEIKAFKLAG